MASLKIILRKEKKADGLFPLAIRITQNRKCSYIYLDYRIPESDWDKSAQRVKKTNLNHTRLNNYLITKLAEATNATLEIDTKKPNSSAKAVRDKIKPSTAETFFAQAESYLTTLKASGKYNQYTADKPRIEHFKTYLKHQNIAFSDITPGLLDRFVTYLRSSHKPKRGSSKIGERTIANHLVAIRSIYAYARKNGVISKNDNPFGVDGIKIKFPDSAKIGLNQDEIERLETVVLPDETQNHARNLWLASYYFAGMRASDLLRLEWRNIHDGRLFYTMGKNGKSTSIKIADKAILILQHYENGQIRPFVFPELSGCDLNDKFSTQRTIAFKTSAIDKCLKNHVAPAAEISKKLTMHIARHSFAQNATHIDVRTLQQLFRHSKLETTEMYMGEFINKRADDALDAILKPKM